MCCFQVSDSHPDLVPIRHGLSRDQYKNGDARGRLQKIGTTLTAAALVIVHGFA